MKQSWQGNSKRLKQQTKYRKLNTEGELKQTRKRENIIDTCKSFWMHTNIQVTAWAKLSFHSCTDTSFHTLQEIQKETWP